MIDKIYKLERVECGVFWFSKEPVRFNDKYNIKFKDGEIAYWIDYLHREDGPAVEYHNGNKYWFWHGEYLCDIRSSKEFEQWKSLKNFR